VTTIPHPRWSATGLDALATFVRDMFWVLTLGIIAVLAFFFALGALKPSESASMTAVAVVLLLLWMAHAWAGRRHAAAAARDPRLVHARERRGF